MKLTMIKLNNFRGGSLELPLTGLDIITGLNGVGKTRVLQAAQLAISGAVPHPVEERNIDLMELFTREIGSSVMSVGVELSDELASFERIYTLESKDGKLSVSQDFEFADTERRKVKEAEKHIQSLLGHFPVMLDVHKFIRLSDEQRAQMMMEIGALDPERWNEGTVREMLFEHCYTNKHSTDQLEDAFRKFSAKIRANIRLGLLDMQEHFKSLESDLKKGIKTMSAAAQGAVQLNVTDGKKSMRPTATINEELNKARADYAKLVNDIANAKAARDQHEKNQKEAAELARKIDAVLETASPEKLAEINIQMSKLSGEITVVPSELLARFEELILATRETKRLIDEAQTKKAVAQNSVLELEKRAKDLEGGKCPTCGQECESALSDVGKLLDEAFGRLTTLTNDVLAYANRLADQADEQIVVEHQIKMHKDAVATAENQLNALRNKHFQMQTQLASIETLQTRLREVRETKIDNALDIDTLEMHLESVKQLGETLNREYTERVQYDTKILQAKEAAALMKAGEEKLATVKSIRERIRTMRWEIVREALEPIEKKASDLFRSATGGFGQNARFAFQFEDARGNEVFKFGWEIENELGKMFVDFDSLSTAQQIFTLVSILAPLIELGNPQFKMLMLDNCEVVHERYRPHLLDLLKFAKEKCYLDNILIASSGDFPDYYPIGDRIEGVNIVNLSEEVDA